MLSEERDIKLVYLVGLELTHFNLRSQPWSYHGEGVSGKGSLSHGERVVYMVDPLYALAGKRPELARAEVSPWDAVSLIIM